MKNLLLISSILLLVLISGAQKLGTLYTTDDGLPHNNVYCITEDINNNLWIGTYSGLSMYDGNTFINFGVSDGLPHEKIKSLETDGNGNIFVGTTLGAAVYDGNSFTVFDSTAGQRIRDILYDQQNRIWFATSNNGIYCLDDTIWYHYIETIDTTNYRFYFCLFEDSSGNIYAGSNKSELFIFDGANWNIFEVDTFNASICRIYGITEDNNGTIWICGKSRQYIDSVNVEDFYYVAEFDGSNFTVYKVNYSFGATITHKSPMIINNNNLIISSYSGVVQFNLTTHKTSILNNRNYFYGYINGLYKSGSNLWVGTGNGLVFIANFSQYDIHNYFENLDTNNYSARFNAMGDMHWDLYGSAASEIPKGSGLSSLFAGNLWVGGLDTSGNLYTAATTFYPNTEFWAGVIANNYNTDYYNKYNRLWKINKSDIDYHILNYNQGGYQIPDEIANWPGSGNTTNGEATDLAPYFDANLNGIYDPQNGDFPKIRGDQAVYFIINDTRLDTHQTTFSLPMGIEVHAMAYSFNDPNNESINNTFFINYKIINRSNKDYHDVYVGQLNTFDLGFYSDDYIGCDSTRNTFFAYNGTDNDYYYGQSPPAQGITFLNTPMYSFMYYHDVLGATGNPTTALEYYNYMQATWKDSTHLTYGSDGYSGTVNTNYHFEINSGWTEESENNISGDRRGIGSTGPFTLNSGDYLCIDVAYPWARDTAGAYSSLLKLVNTTVGDIQAFYDAQHYECVAVSNINENQTYINSFTIYPNPTTGKITVKAEEIERIEVYNITGKTILIHSHKSGNLLIKQTDTRLHGYDIDIGKQPKGIYIIKVTTNKGVAVGKVVLE